VNIITINRDGRDDVDVDGVGDDDGLTARGEGDGDDVCSIPHTTLCRRIIRRPALGRNKYGN
jgi:hypothetical protein